MNANVRKIYKKIFSRKKHILFKEKICLEDYEEFYCKIIQLEKKGDKLTLENVEWIL